MGRNPQEKNRYLFPVVNTLPTAYPHDFHMGCGYRNGCSRTSHLLQWAHETDGGDQCEIFERSDVDRSVSACCRPSIGSRLHRVALRRDRKEKPPNYSIQRLMGKPPGSIHHRKAIRRGGWLFLMRLHTYVRNYCLLLCRNGVGCGCLPQHVWPGQTYFIIL